MEELKAESADKKVRRYKSNQLWNVKRMNNMMLKIMLNYRSEWHFSATLTEGFPCFFLSCEANARVQLTKTGHGPHSCQMGDNFYMVSSSLILVWPLWVRIPESLLTKVVSLCCPMYCLCVNVYCTTATRCQPNCS